MTATPQIRKKLWGDKSVEPRNLGELARDIQSIFDSIPQQLVRTFDDFYREPLVIGTLQTEPTAIELIRITNLSAPESPVLCSGLCHWTWNPQQGGASVYSIAGLTPSTSVRYRFTFRIMYAG